MNSSFVRCTGAILFAILLQACGGGGGGGGGDAGGGIGGTSDTMVSGSVKAPAGLVASQQQDDWATRLASFFISSSHAGIAGIANVPDDTVVELVRVDPITGAAVGAPLATARVSSGRYSFNLTSLKLSYSTTLQARLTPSTGVQLRTFITSAAADLDPNSEAGIQMVLESIAARPGSSLDTMTVKDLDDIVASIDMIASADGITAGITTVATVDAIKARLNARPELTALLDTKLAPEHAAAGPGDIANYFPLSAGDSWTYSVSENGATATIAEVRSVGSAMLRSGAMVMPVSIAKTTFPLTSAGSQAPAYQNTDYYLKDATGLVSYGNSTDPAALTAVAPAYRVLKLPGKVGDTLVSIDQAGAFAIGQDMDGDGISETLAQYKIDSVIAGYQDITVPAGKFRCLVVELHILMAMRGSKNNAIVSVNGTSTWFLAPNVGLVRTDDIASGSSSDGRVMPQQTSRRELVSATVSGATIGSQPVQLKSLSLLHNDLIYDKTRNRLYASVPSSASNGNSIAVINPSTGALVQTVAIGSEPMRLALSKGDEYLYVGLDGSGEVARLNLATMATDLKFSLGSVTAPASAQLFAQDIAVMPDNPQSTLILRKVKAWSPSSAGIASYDNSIVRANQTTGQWPIYDKADAIALSDDGTFAYGIDNQVSSFDLTRFSVSPTGISLLDQTNDLAGNYGQTRMRYLAGRLYLTNGRVIDPINKVLVGTYPGGMTYGFGNCVPDLSPARTYCLDRATTSKVSLISFDRTQFIQLATADTLIPASASLAFGTMVRFGARGFAIGASTAGYGYPSYDKIYLISSDIAL